jgi:TPR repeat protein
MRNHPIDEAKRCLLQGDMSSAYELLTELIRAPGPSRAEALRLLGVSAMMGAMPQIDEAAAVGLLEEAAKQKDGEAAAILWEKTGEVQYKVILIHAATNGDLTAIDSLAKSERGGFFALFGYVAALDLLKRAARDDRIDALLLLADTLQAERDDEEAKRLWSRAAALNHPEGHFRLAIHTDDLAVQVRHHEAAARLGHLESMRWLANHYANTNQRERRLNLLTELADRGDEQAILRVIDDRVEKGRFDEAVAFGKKLPRITPQTAFRLASLYERIGDEEEAVRQFGIAAEGGITSAMLELGVRLLQGKGVVPNAERAAKWIATAAERCHPEALYRLGCLYEAGTGVAKDLALAAFWFEHAASYGHKEAKIKLKESRATNSTFQKDPV